MPSKKPGAIRVFFTLLLGLLYLPFVAFTLRAIQLLRLNNPENIWTQPHELPQAQFAMFWYSGKMLLMAFVNAHGGYMVATAWMQKTFQMPLVASFKPLCLTWLYPPTMGLLAMLYALLPLSISFWVWRGIYMLLAAAALRRAGLGWGAILLGLISPAAWLDFLGGENGTLTGGLLVSSLLMLDARPNLAGILAGCLCIKPQLGVALPLVLLQRPRALAGVAVTAAVLVALTLPLEGWHSWVWFLFGESHSSATLVTTSFHKLFPVIGATSFYMARSFGASVGQAEALQAMSSLLAASLIFYVWRTPRFNSPVARAAFTVSLTILLTPYGYLYDLVGFSTLMAAMAGRAPAAWKPAYGLLWLAPGYSGLIAGGFGYILMPVAAALAALLIWLNESPQPAAPQTRQHAHNPASAAPAPHPLPLPDACKSRCAPAE